jgi:sulfur relay (sulfurtransferase) complex TusBCD TusD component (DsrE family)
MIHVKLHKWLFFVLALVVGGSALMGCVAAPAQTAPASGAGDRLFINLTSDDPHRVNMALSFGMKQLDRGHPLTIFLNDKGVYVGSQANASKFTEQQTTIATLLKKGAVVFICPMCMEHYGIKQADLLPGLKVSDPDAIGEHLFKPNTQTLTW